jgi:4-oxalocrotonate tautomerase
LVEFISFNAWSVGGKNVPTFYLDIKITKGTNTKVQKSQYIQAIYKEFENILGEIHKASYVLIHEIDADAWGFEGITQECRFIKSQTVPTK